MLEALLANRAALGPPVSSCRPRHPSHARAALRRAVGWPGCVVAGWAEPTGCGLGPKAARTLFILYSFSLILFFISKF
jgi:hypothetical protein